MSVVVTGQVEPVRPRSVRSWYMRNGEGDLAALKVITDAFAVPAWVSGVGGTIGSSRASLTDEQVEQCLRDWVFKNINFTGTDAGGTPPTTLRALDIYNWMQTNAALNSGKGPTISCGTSAALKVGFMAAYGIPSRRVWAHSGPHTGVDFSTEFWSPAVAGWVHTIDYLSQHLEWADTGKGASLLDEVTVGRQLGSLTGVINRISDGAGGANTAYRSGVVVDLTGYWDWCLWGRGDRMQFVSALTASGSDPNFGDDRNLSGNLIAALAQTAQAASGNVTPMYTTTTVARDLTDIAYTPAALMADARLTISGLVEVALDALMLDTGVTYQVLAPGGAWTALTGPYHTFKPTGQAWQYRVLGPRGNTSNVVSVTA